jgi:hypothetical protein
VAAENLRLDLARIGDALLEVEHDWSRIDAELERLKLGRKHPFDASLRSNMVCAYAHLDELLAEQVKPFSDCGIEHMLTLNNLVHYGDDEALTAQFASAIEANVEKFNDNIDPIIGWYQRHRSHGDHPYKLAAETYVSILGQPQLFVEGNHRTGSLIASWINLMAGLPPFVLSVDNAIAYFAPSAEIKLFANKATWRGRARLPKYRKSFRAFWENHVDSKYLREAAITTS